MPTINYSVTQSIATLAVNLSASEALVMNISNPLIGASYFGLETIPDSNGVYTSASPKNTSGSFTLGTGVLGVVKDDYKMGAVVSPGNNVLTFVPAQAVTGSTLRTRGIAASPPSTGFDADAQAFFDRVTAAGGTLSATEQTAVNTLVIQMKADGIWSGMKAIYPMVGASAAACAQNLRSSSFTGTFTSGWTFASTGVTPNGTSAYMDSGVVPSSNLTSGNTHASVYLRTNTSAGTKQELGSILGDEFSIIVKFTGDFAYPIICNNANVLYPGYSNTNSQGMWTINRVNTSNIQYYNRGTNVIDSLQTNGMSTRSLYVGARNNSGSADRFTDRQFAFASIGDGLSATNMSNFYTAVQAFQTTLSRAIAP